MANTHDGALPVSLCVFMCVCVYWGWGAAFTGL